MLKLSCLLNLTHKERWQVYDCCRTLKAYHKSSLSQHQMDLRLIQQKAYYLNHSKPTTTSFSIKFFLPPFIHMLFSRLSRMLDGFLVNQSWKLTRVPSKSPSPLSQKGVDGLENYRPLLNLLYDVSVSCTIIRSHIGQKFVTWWVNVPDGSFI